MYSIDRIEGNYALLERDGETLNILLSELPEGVQEGDVLDRTAAEGWVIRRDLADERRNALAERRRELLEGRK